MSPSSSSSSGCGSTQPLTDILPWGSPVLLGSSHGEAAKNASAPKHTSRTVLISDSLSTDARFLLHTLALQFLSSKIGPQNNDADEISGSVLWICCGSPPVTEKQIALQLRKAMQHNLGDDGSSSFGSVSVANIPSELADAALQSEDKDFFHEAYLRRLHGRIVYWLQHGELLTNDNFIEKTKSQTQNTGLPNASRRHSLIIIDGALTLATLFGDNTTQMFISSTSASLKSYTKKLNDDSTKSQATLTNILAVRCTSPDDGGLYNITDLTTIIDSGRTKGQKLRSEYSRLLRPWLGVGSAGVDDTIQIFHIEEQSHHFSLQPQSTAAFLSKSGLYELADAIVDVSPLESGYARDVLGRLSFSTTWNGNGWWGRDEDSAGQGGNYGSICVNYRCDDSGVRIMRLRCSK
jgi:hypothetical protein